VPPFRFFTERAETRAGLLKIVQFADRSVIDRFAERLAQTLASESAVPYRNRRVSDGTQPLTVLFYWHVTGRSGPNGARPAPYVSANKRKSELL